MALFQAGSPVRLEAGPPWHQSHESEPESLSASSAGRPGGLPETECRGFRLRLSRPQAVRVAQAGSLPRMMPGPAPGRAAVTVLSHGGNSLSNFPCPLGRARGRGRYNLLARAINNKPFQ